MEESEKVVSGEKGPVSAIEASQSKKHEDHKQKPIEQYLFLLSEVKQSHSRQYANLYGSFYFKSDCLFCSTPVTFDRTKKKEDSFKVRTRDFENTQREICEKRNDDWLGAVITRTGAASEDLHAAEVIYHKSG